MGRAGRGLGGGGAEGGGEAGALRRRVAETEAHRGEGDRGRSEAAGVGADCASGSPPASPGVSRLAR